MEWMRSGLRAVASVLNRVAGPPPATEEENEVEEEEEEEDEMERLGKGVPLFEITPEVAYVVAPEEQKLYIQQFMQDRLEYSMDNLPSTAQVMEDLKKKTGLKNCDFYSLDGRLNEPCPERPIEIRWDPLHYNIVKVVPR